MSLLDKASLIVTPNAYKESKLYSVVPSTGTGDMTVVRATTATRVNSEGLIESVGVNIPRIDYTNGSCPSLLLEPQRTNLLIGSNAFVGAGWAISGSATINSNFAISPDGTQNSAKLTTPTQGISGIYQVISGTASIDYSRSLYIKSVSGNTETIRITDPYGSGTDGILVTINGQWNRYTFTNPLSGGVNGGIWLNNIPTAGIYIYGSQIEQGSYATSYIPTVASAVTRNADVISKTGISSLINSQEGVMFIEASALANNSSARFIELNENLGSLTNTIYFRYEPTNNEIAFTVFANGALQCNISYSLANQTDLNKMAFVWALNRFEIWVNGNKVVEDNIGTTPAINTLNKIIFNNTFSVNPFDGKLKSLQLYKNALTNTELAQLTTI